jgi:bacteriorhodopsin
MAGYGYKRAQGRFLPKFHNPYQEVTMSAEIQVKKDYFWLYVAIATVAAVLVIAMVKLSENDKYDPIRQQQAEEAAQMNIRVLN